MKIPTEIHLNLMANIGELETLLKEANAKAGALQEALDKINAFRLEIVAESQKGA